MGQLVPSPEPALGACRASPRPTSVRFSCGSRYQPPRVVMPKIGWPGFMYVTAPPRA
jgi:hypothetical protein